MDRRVLLVAGLSALIAGPALAKHHHGHGGGLADATLLIVRHAEKPASGPDLSPAGERRAQAYATYFQHFQVQGQAVHIDALVATADSPASDRPRLTLTPLSQAINLPIQQPCADKDVKGQAEWLAAQPPGRTTLIAWHHGKIPKLVSDLGGDLSKWLTDGKWPSTVFDWVVVLRYDAKGKLVYQDVIHEPKGLDK